MDYSKVKEALEAAQAKAKELNTNVTVAIVDEYGCLVGLSRMEGAIKVSPEFATAKAYSAGTIGVSTSDLAKYAVEGQPYFGLTSILGGKITTIPGGVPIVVNGKLVGGVGVGGSQDVSQDVECAKVASNILSN